MSGESSGIMELFNYTNTINPRTITLKRARNQPRSKVPGGILRNRGSAQSSTTSAPKLLADPRLTELLARLMASQGIPFDCVDDSAFADLIHYFLPDTQMPAPKVLEAIAEKNGSSHRPRANLAKSMGTLSVTFDVFTDVDDKYLVFSIHFFKDSITREHSVYLRKLTLTSLDETSILTCLRRAVCSYNYTNVKFTNIVFPNTRVDAIFNNSDSFKRNFVCFYDYVSRFANRLFDIAELRDGYEKMRVFVASIRKDYDLYCRFRRLQLARNEELDLPSVEERSWFSHFSFLSRCLHLHHIFVEFSSKFSIKNYVTPETFNILIYFQKILQQCAKCCLSLSGPLNSISQVIPAVIQLRTFISNNTCEYPFEMHIKNAFTNIFYEIVNGPKSTRYDVAALLDPRSGYHTDVYSQATWNSIERILISEFLKTEVNTSEREFDNRFFLMSNQEKSDTLTAELKTYRKRLCMIERPDENADPFYWWGQQEDVEYLEVLAREYLACPAVSIDASYFFGNKGKMNRLCKTYSYDMLECCLNFAGNSQEYRGKGRFSDRIRPHRAEGLEKLLFNDSLNFSRVYTPYLAPTQPGFVPMMIYKSLPGKPQYRNVPIMEPNIPPQSMLLETEIKEEVIEPVAESPNPPIPFHRPAQKIVPVISSRPTVIARIPIRQMAPLPNSLQPVPKVYIPVNSAMPRRPAPKVVVSSSSSSSNLLKPDEVKEELVDDSELYAAHLQSFNLTTPGSVERTLQVLKACKRTCVLCDSLCPQDHLKNVTIDMERLLCIFGMVYRKIIDLNQAQSKFARFSKSYYCRVHFPEACDAIFSALNITSAAEVEDAPLAQVLEIGETVGFLRERPISLSEFRRYLINFTAKYSIPNGPLQQVTNTKKLVRNLFDESLFHDEQDKEEILPKVEREPRKQILENVERHSQTIVQIEQDPFKLPEAPVTQSESEELGVDNEICCFCLVKKHKQQMLKVPNSVDRRARWVHKLGSAFASRLKPGDNYLCRSHFANLQFSSRGRLLKGMLPVTESERVTITYKVDGGNILKMHESKVGTDRGPTVDLTDRVLTEENDSEGLVKAEDYLDEYVEEDYDVADFIHDI